MARSRPADDAARGDGGATLVDAGDDGDTGDGEGAMATLMPTGPRPPWPASRRARALARRRLRAVGNGGGAGVAPVLPAGIGIGRTGGDWLRRRRRLVLVAMATLLAGGVALTFVGIDLVRDSTAGRYVESTAGPDDPGYQAYVVPTPTMAVVHRDADGELAGVAVLALESTDEGGTVVLLPASTLARQVPSAPPDGSTEAAGQSTDESSEDDASTQTLADVYRQDGAQAAVAAVADLLAVAIPEQLEVDNARWESLVAPVGPVELQLTRTVGSWQAGEVSLAAEDVGAFLGVRAEDEPEAERVARQADFWTAWLPLVREAGVDALPGEVDVGIGRFVRSLADGSPSVVPLPGEPWVGDGIPEAYLPHDARVADLVARAVPSPVSPSPDRRIRVRLLNGTTDRDLTAEAARVLVRGGAEITIAGNADSFDEPETRLLYGSPGEEGKAQWLAASLGDAPVERDPAADADATGDDEIDVTVILGADAEDLIGR